MSSAYTISSQSETWQAFRLIPDDVLFFRDGKPSSQGSDHYLRSIFPPHPYSLYGAVRTRRLLDEGVPLKGLKRLWPSLPAELRAELGEWLGFGELELRGPWLVRSTDRGDEVLLPAPADLLVETEPRDRRKGSVGQGAAGPRRAATPAPPPRAGRVARLRPATGATSGGDALHPLAPLHPFLPEDGGWKPVTLEEQRRFKSTVSRSIDWWLTPAGLAAWRSGRVPDGEHLVHREELWVDEQRTGVGLTDDERKAEDSMIYTFGFVRLQPGVALGFEARHTGLRPGGRVRLGGEARTVTIEEGPAFPAPEPEERPRPGEAACLAFATPALSSTGAWPPGFSEGSGAGEIGGLPVRLAGASVGGFGLVGGWDLAKGAPKPLRRAVPAGSVYLMQPAGGGREEDTVDLAALDGMCWSDYDDQYLARQGFGLVLVGRN